MRFNKAALWGVALVLVLGVGFVSGRAQEKRSNRIVAVYGVGGVIREDGSMWQYLPQHGWLSIDDAFKQDGRETHIVPLPVAADEIAFMESWGFIVSTQGQVWHYDLERNRWEDVGTP